MTTISGTVNQSITLGSGGYTDPLTITDAGAVFGSGGTLAVSVGVILPSDGTLANAGVIVGGSANLAMVPGGAGVELVAGGTLTNTGQIDGGAQGGVGVELLSGGTLANAGTIAGGNLSPHLGGDGVGVELLAGGTVTNTGFITGGSKTFPPVGGYGVVLAAAAALTNFGVISGGGFFPSAGVDLNSGATLTNYGTISSVQFGTAGATLVVEPGAVNGTIGGFAKTDIIELSGLAVAGSSFVSGVLTLDLVGGGTTTLDLPGAFTSAGDFAVTNVAAGADVTVACFTAGTRILTPAGEMPVDQLRTSDHVATTSGSLAPIIWAGHQRARVRPVRVRCGAFGEHVPARDLLLSPDHAVFVKSALIPIRHLINDTTIVEEAVDAATYYHIELAKHGVFLAEGLPCESYLDTGNRTAFVANENAVLEQDGFWWNRHGRAWHGHPRLKI